MCTVFISVPFPLCPLQILALPALHIPSSIHDLFYFNDHCYL